MSMLIRRAFSNAVPPGPPVYATWNPSDKGASVTLSGGNLKASFSSAGSVRATISKSSGKWYWEYKYGGSAFRCRVGIANASESLANQPGYTSDSLGYDPNGKSYTSNTASTYGATHDGLSVMGVALDADASTITFYKSGTSQGSLTYIFTGGVFPMAGAYSYGTDVTANFGATALTYTPPSGYNAGLYS